MKNNRATYIAGSSCSYLFPGWATVHGVTNSQTCLSDLKKKKSPHYYLSITRLDLHLNTSSKKEKKKSIHFQTLSKVCSSRINFFPDLDDRIGAGISYFVKSIITGFWKVSRASVLFNEKYNALSSCWMSLHHPTIFFLTWWEYCLFINIPIEIPLI